MISRSFVSISPYIRPAPGASWAPRARWYAINTGWRKEARVAKEIAGMKDMGPHRVFLPFMPCVPKIRGKEREPVPLIPKTMFVLTELAAWPTIRSVKFVTGFECDPEGFPDPIPDAQMETFRRVHGEWLAEASRRAALGKAIQGRGARAKKRSVPFRDALIELQQRMEGK